MTNFDQAAKDWDVNPQMIERAGILAQELKAYFAFDPRTQTAFEFGSGTGLLGLQLGESLKSLVLADSSAGMIEVLANKISKQNLKNLHPLLIEMPANKPDIRGLNYIFSFMALHHVKEIDKLLHIFNEMLQTNGHLCIADLVSEDGSFHSHDPHFDGHKGFDRQQLENMLSAQGFKTRFYKIFYHVEKEFEKQIRTYPLFLMIAEKI